MIKHTLTNIPKNIRKETAIVTVIGVITSFGFDALSFFLQLGKNEITKGRIILGLVLISLYFVKNTLDTFMTLWLDDITTTYKNHYTTAMNSKTVEVLLKVRGKVWRTNNETHSRELMSTNSLLTSSRQYISLVWDFKTGLPRNIVQTISVIAMFIGFVAVTTLEIEHTMMFVLIIVVVSVLSVVFSVKRITLKNRFRKERKKHKEESGNALNDVLNIEPINSKHAYYMANKYIGSIKASYKYDKADRKSINKVNFLESIVDSLSTITIIAMKVCETGIENVDLNVVLSIIALVAIYSQIMNKVNSIVHMAEDYKEMLNEMKAYEPDFREIVGVFDRENADTGDCGSIKKVEVPNFNVQYQAVGAETPFSLVNGAKVTFYPGDIVLLCGPTGSGKSTFMKMVTGKLEFEAFELYYERKKPGTINALMHQTDGKLGYSSILSEITLGEELDKDKLFYILKGLHLYEEISEKDEDVLEYLRNSTVQNYSTGQKQRLAIARLLYNLDDTVQIIGFDEATNALNDEITLQTLNFIKSYCAGKILLIATHQVDIGKTVANKKFEFVSHGPYYEIVPN